MAERYDLVDYVTGKAALPVIRRTIVKGTIAGWFKKMAKDVSRAGMRKEALNVFADEVLLRDIDREDEAKKKAKADEKAAKKAEKPKA